MYPRKDPLDLITPLRLPNIENYCTFAIQTIQRPFFMEAKTKQEVKHICVFCGSSSQTDPRFAEEARQLGRWMGERSKDLVYGAGNVGLMGILADAVMQHGSQVKGVIPQFMVDAGWHHEGIQELIITRDMHERKRLMCDNSDAIIAFPGGIGTGEELLEALTWKQLGLITKPIIILNINGHFNPLLQWLDQLIEGKFMRDIHRNMWVVVHQVSELDDAFQQCLPWDSSVRKIAAI